MEQKRITIVYESVEGHTATIATKLQQLMHAQGHAVTVTRCRDAGPDELQADRLVLGSSIHVGRHNAKTIRFVKKHLDIFRSKPSAFFLVCLTARSENPEQKATVERYLREFSSLTGWEPPLKKCFAGALLYTKYNFIKRKVMLSIAKKEKGDVDTSRDYVYTDWRAVEAFATELSALAR